MDIELHDHMDEDFLEELEDETSHHVPIRKTEDLDDDSFGEASDNCEPDQEYMEQILEECHPERLNLLEQSVPEAVYNKPPRSAPPLLTRTLKQASRSQEEDIPPKRSSLLQLDDETQTAEPSISENAKSSLKDVVSSTDIPSPQQKKRDVFNSKTTEDSESNTEEENEDAFTKSPKKRAPRLGVDRSKLLGSMGSSRKKSLRTINGTFWSKPFKGLAQSMRRNGGAQGVTDS